MDLVGHQNDWEIKIDWHTSHRKFLCMVHSNKVYYDKTVREKLPTEVWDFVRDIIPLLQREITPNSVLFIREKV